MAGLRRHRRFAVFNASFVLLVALGSVAYSIFGRSLLGGTYKARGHSEERLAALLHRADLLHEAFLVFSACLLLFVGLAYALRVKGMPWWTYGLLVLAAYAGIEGFIAPRLAAHLTLRNYYYARDPDHRPKSTDRRKGFNSDSLRCRHQPAEFQPAGLNVVFLGDSFTYGLRLEPGQSFPAKVERYLRGAFPDRDLKVANFAWTSSSPFLSLRRLVEIGERYHPDFVVLCIDMTDFMDDIRWNYMLERQGIYWFYDKIPLTLKIVERFLPALYDRLYAWTGLDMPTERFFISEQPLELSRPYTRPLVENLTKIHAWCMAHAARFLVLVLPRTYQYSARECPNNWEAEHYTELGAYALEPFRFFEELAQEVDYPIHSLLADFQTTDVFPTAFDDDPHWNDAGATVAAEAIARILKQEIDGSLTPPGR